MDKKITGFLVLKDRPSEYGTIRALQNGEISKSKDIDERFRSIHFKTTNGGNSSYTQEYCLANPDFFQPIYEGQKVCDECGGLGLTLRTHIAVTDTDYPYITECPKCHGRRVVPIEEKPAGKPPYDWPPKEGQETFYLEIDSIGYVYVVFFVWHGGPVENTYPTKDVAQEAADAANVAIKSVRGKYKLDEKGGK